MKKRIIVTAAITACFTLCAAVWAQAETVKETPTPPQTPAVSASQPPLLESEELVIPVITEIEKQTKPDLPAQPEAEHESTTSNSEDMVYVPGFGWIESQGPSHVEYAEDVYENGNKIGIMG